MFARLEVGTSLDHSKLFFPGLFILCLPIIGVIMLLCLAFYMDAGDWTQFLVLAQQKVS